MQKRPEFKVSCMWLKWKYTVTQCSIGLMFLLHAIHKSFLGHNQLCTNSKSASRVIQVMKSLDKVYRLREFVISSQKKNWTYSLLDKDMKQLQQHKKEIHQQSYQCKKIIYFSKNALFKSFLANVVCYEMQVKCKQMFSFLGGCWGKW